MKFKESPVKVIKVICSYVLISIYRLLTWFLSLFILPAVITGVLPLAIWKYLVILCRKLFHWKELVSPLLFYDMVFAGDKFYHRPYSANVTFFILQGYTSLESLKRNFTERVIKKPVNNNQSAGEKTTYQYSRLHKVPRRFGCFYFWKGIHIDPELQIREIVLKNKRNHRKNADVNISEHHLNAFLGELMTSPFSPNGGLWELILLNNFEGEKSVVIFRMHHVLGDGYSVNSIVDEMIGERSRYIVKNKKLSFHEQLELLWKAPAWILNLCIEELTMSNWSNKRKKSATGVVSITTIPLHVIKLIRKTMNCHFATIGLSLLGGALRRLYLEGHNLTELPGCIKIMHLLPKPEHPLNTLCNHWSAGAFKIPLKTCSALERLKETEASFEYLTTNNYDQLVQMQSYIANYLPAPVYNWFLSRNHGTSMTFTSLPAYEKPAQLWGQPILNMYKICGLQYKQISVAAAAYTHNGQVAYTILANKDIVPTQAFADRLTKQYLHMELNQLITELQLNNALI